MTVEINLIDYQELWIPRGSVLRVRSIIDKDPNWYVEKQVDLMVFDATNLKGIYGLIAVSGTKAGLINIVFPQESSDDESVGLRTKWLVDNWEKWVHPAGDVDSVILILL